MNVVNLGYVSLCFMLIQNISYYHIRMLAWLVENICLLPLMAEKHVRH